MFTKKIILLFVSIVSLIVSFVFMFFLGETIFRIREQGFVNGLKSYFLMEAPKSNMPNNGWVMSDDELGYRRNPDSPGVNEYSMLDHEITVPKPKGIKRIVILGDSIPCTGNPTFVDLLKEKFKNDPSIEIINASTPGYTNYQELVFLKRYITKIEPDMVILGYVLNDNYKFLHVFDEKNNMLWSKEAQKSLSLNSQLDPLINKSAFLTYLKVLLVERKNRSRFKDAQQWWNDAIDFNTAWKDETWPDIDNQVQTMNSLLKAQGAQLLVVAFPLKAQVDDYPALVAHSPKACFSTEGIDYQQTILKPQRNIIALAKKQGIVNLDLFPAFYDRTRATGEDLYTDGLHLSTAGHQLTAEKVSELIVQHLR